MKKIKTRKISIVVLSFALLVLSLTVVAFAESEEKNAMTDIVAAFSDKQVGEKVSLESDGYIGIPVELTTYYDYNRFGSAKTGYYGTNIVLYFVNI